MKLRHILYAAAAVLAFASCKQEEPVEAAKITVGETSLTIAAKGETKSVSVSSNCDWTAATSTSWAKVSPTNGTSSTSSVSLLIEENASGANREATLTITSTDGTAKAEVKISQTGEAENEYEIKSAENFSNFLANAINASDTDEYKILADIDMEGATLTPAIKFDGILDGGGHKIYNFKVVSSQVNAGLFLMLNGTVKNLVIGSKDGSKYDGSSLITFTDDIAATGFAGALCGVLAGQIDGVKNFAKIRVAVNNTSLAGVAGIAGMTETASSVKNSENNGTIELSGVTGAEFYASGIIAYINSADAVVEKCVNNAEVTIPFVNTKASMFGGIIGRANLGAQIIDCQNNGPVSFVDPSTETAGTYIMIAGIAGALYTGSGVLRCVNKGEVSSNRLQVSRIGGIVGTLNSKGFVDNCTNYGEVNLKHSAPNANWQAAGGIVGFQEKQSEGNFIRNNINNGKVTVVVENTTTHQNRVSAGGILGLGILGLEVSGNTNNADVSVTNKAAGDAFAGGVTGWLRGATVMKDNVNKGAVSCTTSDNALAYAGGVVGCVSEAAYGASSAAVTGDKNEGAVTCGNAAGAGSVAGYNGGSLASCVSGGSVNGVAINDSNFANLAVGTNIGSVEDIKSPSGSSATVAKISVEPTEIRVAAEAGTTTFAVTCNVDWTVTCDASWVTSFTASGKENGTVEIAYAANESTENERTATFTVTAVGADPLKVTLTQGKVLSGAPHAITSVADLADFAAASAVEAPDFAAWQDKDGIINITTDIDASSIANLQIGNIPAGVVINGNDHKIYNITSVSSDSNTGLILLNKGTVKNLILGSSDGASYDGKSAIGAEDGKGGNHTGLIAENEGTVENVVTFVTVNHNAAAATKEHGVSCLVGHAGENSVIKGCTNKATLNITGAMAQIIDAGMIVGFMNNAGASVEGCSNEAAQTISVQIKKVLHLGGIVGRIGAVVTVTDCHNKAAIALDQKEAPSTWMSIGGVIGSNYLGGVISKCDNSGAVSSNHIQVVRIGGIAGVLNTGGSFSECTNTGAVTLTQTSNNNWQAIGGILGFQEKSAGDKDNIITGCVNKGAVTVSIDNATTHVNKVSVGGVIGAGSLALNVTGNTNEGEVKVTNAAAGTVYAGGIYGGLFKHSKECTFSGNVNTGAVSAATSDNANSMAGGVVGYIAANSGSDDANKVALTLSGEKSTGAVTCANTTMVGAIAGNNGSGVLDKCIAGGSVNGTAVTADNLSTLVQGSASTGTASGTQLAQ